MNKQEIKETFQKNDLHVTQAVKILLKQASLYAKRIKAFKESDEKLNADKIAECEEQRAKYIYKAIKTAAKEKQQHWRFIEDQRYYNDKFNDKYGDIDFATNWNDIELIGFYLPLGITRKESKRKRCVGKRGIGVMEMKRPNDISDLEIARKCNTFVDQVQKIAGEDHAIFAVNIENGKYGEVKTNA
ncbi:hypothetical protein HMPREF9104_01176 [Lentilactobacillus kisonensis F0435]|uniref:Uncharacterized protein n=3 Tax=Lentilactobacillus TaxID=2767893 RepID=H1LF00_9LACO|nr:hypothetical protein HMPREF9104_01176 [Lentilactobacillus kisonensis F0435]